MTQTWNKGHAGNLSAEIIYVVPPTEEQLAKIKILCCIKQLWVRYHAPLQIL